MALRTSTLQLQRRGANSGDFRELAERHAQNKESKTKLSLTNDEIRCETRIVNSGIGSFLHRLRVNCASSIPLKPPRPGERLETSWFLFFSGRVCFYYDFDACIYGFNAEFIINIKGILGIEKKKWAWVNQNKVKWMQTKIEKKKKNYYTCCKLKKKKNTQKQFDPNAAKW